MSNPDALRDPTPEEIEQAQQMVDRRRLEVSGTRFQPKIVWTLWPHTQDGLRRVIEADGYSPHRFLGAIALDRRALKFAGAPPWAQWAYLVMVEVRALNVR